MDVVPSIWLSSVAGALLFFASGRLWGRSPVSAPPAGLPEAEPEALARARGQVEATGRELGEARSALAAERDLAASLRREVEGERAASAQRLAEARAQSEAEVGRLNELCDRLQREAVHLRARAGDARPPAEEHARVLQLSGELDSHRARLRERDGQLVQSRSELAAAAVRQKGLEQRAAHLEAELLRANAVVEEAAKSRHRLEGELAQAHQAARASVEAEAAGRQREARLTRDLERARGELAGAQARGEEAERLRAENAELRARLDAFAKERASAGELAELTRKNLELAMKVRVFEQRAGELEQKGAENEELRRRVEVLGDEARAAAELRQKVADLSARGYALEARAQVSAPARSPRADERFETVLERSLEAVRRRDSGCRSAILSDMRGLLIASSGERTIDHELAAVASLTSDTAQRLRGIIPVGAPLSLELRDENQVVLTTHWLRCGGEGFLLSTLGVSSGPPGDDLAELHAELVGLLGAS